MDDPLRAAIERELVVEREGWAHERVTRVTALLQRGLPEAERLVTIVIWSELHTAFTAPGRTIYFARRLLERLPDDDAAAFVVAHELAHHRLGHVPRPSRAWAALPLVVGLHLLERWIAGPEQERDADLLAIELCIDAGFDPERCLVALDLLRHTAIDYGDLDGALGVESGGWRWSRARGYWSLRERAAAVRAHLVAVRGGRRLQVAAARERERRRRRMALLAAAGSTALAAGLIILRRRLR